MRFEAEHRFPAPVGAVVDVLGDPSFHVGLELPDVQLTEVVDHRDDGNEAVLTVRYEFVGHLDPVVQRLLGGRRLTWLQELVLDRAGSGGRLTFAADANADRLHGEADFVFTPDGHATVRRLDGEVRVAVPLIAGKAERRIVDGLRRRLDIEAQQLTVVLGSL